MVRDRHHTTDLALDEVHVWRLSLDRPPLAVEGLRGLLSADERERASRFRHQRDSSRYIVGRAELRTRLGRYLDHRPEDLQFTYGKSQKPMLVGGGIQFNLAHSGAVALLAFSKQAEVGVDVELEDVDGARTRIAERFFSPAEVTALRALPERVQPRAFLTCWTRKEAFVKARGDGLGLPLDSFEVSLEPGRPAALLRTGWSSDEPRRWRLYDLSDRREGYIAAAAIRSERCRIVRHTDDDATDRKK